jgi:rRNA maturation RNase YbeY
MTGELSLRNRQRTRPVNLRLLRRITRCLLTDFLRPRHFELGLHLVAAPEMARLNAAFLHHQGSTDVITFDHSDNVGQASRLPPTARERASLSAINGKLLPVRDRRDACPTFLHGEIFLSLDDALAQARQFHTTWQSELVRYLVHGLLHLCGHEDRRPAARGRMKREENRLLRELSRRFALSELGRKPNLRP